MIDQADNCKARTARPPGQIGSAWTRVLFGLALVLLPATAHAFQVRIPVWALYLNGLVIGGPGMILSILLLRRALGRGKGCAVLLTLWLVGMPWVALIGVDLVTPGILGRLHAYGAWEILLRVWVLASLFVVLPAAAVRAWMIAWRKAARHQQGLTEE